MRVLGIESSCDETAVAIYCAEQGLLSHQIYSQVQMHAEFGGVVPELASRDHVRKIVPLIKASLEENGGDWRAIDAIAYTAGPGLMGALLVGSAVARALGFALNKKLIPVHHLEAHILAPLIEPNGLDYPFIALLVSGGHTQLIRVSSYREYELLGESCDDAAGEAFDKTAKLLGLPYPGGPALARLADAYESSEQSILRHSFPRPMVDRPGLDFSFSGLKTYVRNVVERDKAQGTLSADRKNEIADAFQEAVVDTLAIKCRRAVSQTGIDQLVLCGGVAANRRLRERLSELDNIRCYYPRSEFCTDNGAMVAFAGYQALVGERDGVINQLDDEQHVVRPRWPLFELNR